MIQKTRIILLCFFLVSSSITFSQNWQWEWANKSTNIATDSWAMAIHSDFLNNTYCLSRYSNAIYFPDTSFMHQEQYSSYGNSAISIYDNRGTFINALDFYTSSGEVLRNLKVVTDDELNMYFSVEFNKTIYFQNVILNATPSSFPVNSDILIGKLNKNYQLQWYGLIASEISEESWEMILSEDNHIYMLSRHQSNPATGPIQVSYLDQDTIDVNNTSLISLSKIDTDGNLLWIKELWSSGISPRQLFIGDDDCLYVKGQGYTDFTIDNDTVIHPVGLEAQLKVFITKFNQDGEYLDGYYIDWDVWMSKMRPDTDGNYYVSGSIQDSAVIGNDTLVVPGGGHWGIVGKFDHDLNPIWYHRLEEILSPWFTKTDESIIISSAADGNVTIADTTLNLGNKDEIIAAEFSLEGDLINLIRSECSGKIGTFYFLNDNCGNPIMAGSFFGTVVFGKDTIQSYTNDYRDAFVAKILRNEPEELDLGNDTIACEHFTLNGPEGYSYYVLNGELSTQNTFEITDSGEYYFGCANESGCWSYDTIKIDIYHGINVSLGNDTLIRDVDTISFVISHPYDSFLWSDGSTGNSITLIGNQLGIGEFPIWVQITDGSCILSDTLMLTVKDSYGIGEYANNLINVYPNPFNEKFTIEIQNNFQFMEILDLNGEMIYSKEINAVNKTEQIELKDLADGIYFLKIKTKDQILVRKIIKN